MIIVTKKNNSVFQQNYDEMFIQRDRNIEPHNFTVTQDMERKNMYQRNDTGHFCRYLIPLRKNASNCKRMAVRWKKCTLSYLWILSNHAGTH